MIWEFIVLGVILLISTFLEKVFFEINPFLWIIGGIIALVFGVLGIGLVSWLEAVICCVIALILTLFSVNIKRYVGGGVLKGLMMCTLFLGRYVLITYVLFFLVGFIFATIRKCIKKDDIPGDSLVSAMPLVTACVAVTVLIAYIFFM